MDVPRIRVGISAPCWFTTIVQLSDLAYTRAIPFGTRVVNKMGEGRVVDLLLPSAFRARAV